MPVKAPHYHLMGGQARHADPAAVQQALPRHSLPGRALKGSSQPCSVGWAGPDSTSSYGQAGEAL